MRNRKFLKIILFSLILSIIIPCISVTATDLLVCKNYRELYSEILEDVILWEESADYRTVFEPKKLSLEKIKENVREKDYILSCCLYSINWKYEKLSDGSYSVRVSYEYYMTERQREKVEKMAEDFAKKLESLSDYEKVKAAHDYIVLNCEYSLFHNGPYNCLYEGRACCNGYALAFQMMMDACGIDCRYVESTNHAWNAVCIDGVFYNLDATWDDNGTDTVSYTYFLKSNADFPDHPGADATAIVSYDCDAGNGAPRKKLLFATPLFLMISKYWWVAVIIVAIGIFVVAEIVAVLKPGESANEEA